MLVRAEDSAGASPNPTPVTNEIASVKARMRRSGYRSIRKGVCEGIGREDIMWAIQ